MEDIGTNTNARKWPNASKLHVNIDVGSLTVARVRVRGQAHQLKPCAHVCDVVLNHLRNMPLLQTCTVSSYFYTTTVSPLSLDTLNGRTPIHGAPLPRDSLRIHAPHRLLCWRAKDASKTLPPIEQICPCSQLLVI